jgi:hemerythrin-like domain-containing protein
MTRFRLLAMNGIASRRSVLRVGTAVGAAIVGAAAGSRAEGHPAAKTPRGKSEKGEQRDKGEEDVGPGEDLMREHGVLRRVLLVYGEAGRRLEAGADLDAGVIQKGAGLIRKFIEDYHERQEEEMVFPLFERAHKLVELVTVLRAQHRAGRQVTERVQALATAAALKDGAQRRQLRTALGAFIRMYEPHASREDTVLFPALHDIVSRSEYDALGEDFERREHRTFGADGFEQAVAEVDALEKALGIEDLALFTPAP